MDAVVIVIGVRGFWDGIPMEQEYLTMIVTAAKNECTSKDKNFPLSVSNNRHCEPDFYVILVTRGEGRSTDLPEIFWSLS